MSAADDDTQQKALVRVLRHFAAKLGERPEYSPDVVELVQAFDGLADLAESAAVMPASNRVAALLAVMEKAVARLG